MSQLNHKKNTIRFRLANENSGEQVFKALFTHPMETGLRRDYRTGKTIPADYIETVRITVDGQDWFDTRFSENVSMNPFLSLVFTKPIVDEQLFRIAWVDNYNVETFYEVRIAFEGKSVVTFFGNDKGEVVPLIIPAGPVCKTRQAGTAQ